MTKTAFLFLCISSFFIAQLQSQRISEKGVGIVNLERHQFAFGTGFRYEIGLFRNVSASTSLAPALAMYSEGYTFGLAWNIRMRYYHNFQERLDINKNVVGNSANYIGPARSAFFGGLQLANNFDAPNGFDKEFFGGVYGIQRTYRSGFNFNAEIGVGYYRSEFLPSGYGGLFSFMVGWVPMKKKARTPVFD
ncbi:hypothetical protein ACFQZJ_04815 [Maribacter chungangensis]|uniref:DUF3575 domain-containing protein n=1 Tax=Maribacter chungangensis TaxID=1069117 RepID=A0ABW3B1R1_9FLAO